MSASCCTSPQAGSRAFWARRFSGVRDTRGFTLVELLIAMTLTAIIGAVLFSTYGMVMDNGKHVRELVLRRESERVLWGVLDNDMAGLCRVDTERGTLPPLSREPISLSDAYYRTTETERPERSADRVVLSFATSSRLAETPASPLPGPVCVEYVLRDGEHSPAFIRRERDFCGVDGDFPWTELVLVRTVKLFEVALYTGKTQFVTEWSSPVTSNTFPEAVRFTLQRETDPEPTVFLAPLFPQRPYAD